MYQISLPGACYRMPDFLYNTNFVDIFKCFSFKNVHKSEYLAVGI